MQALHPKVKVTALVTTGVGAALVALGVVLPDATVRILGEGAVGTGLLGLGVGYKTPVAE